MVCVGYVYHKYSSGFQLLYGFLFYTGLFYPFYGANIYIISITPFSVVMPIFHMPSYFLNFLGQRCTTTLSIQLSMGSGYYKWKGERIFPVTCLINFDPKFGSPEVHIDEL